MKRLLKTLAEQGIISKNIKVTLMKSMYLKFIKIKKEKA